MNNNKKVSKSRKSRKSRTVKKMLSPEEMTIVSNIESMLGELSQMSPMGESPAMGEPAPVMEQEAPMTEEMAIDEETDGKEVKMILKGETTLSESATASDDAEERMEEPMTELSEENLNEVEKAFRTLMGAVAQKNVKKSISNQKSPIVQVLNKIVEVQKSNQNQVQELSNAFGHILEGIGVTKQIEAIPDQNRNPKAINKNATEDLLAVLKSLTQGNSGVNKESSEPKSQNNAVRKNLGNRETLTGLIGR